MQQTTKLDAKAHSFGYYMDETYRGKSSQNHQKKNHCVLAPDPEAVCPKTIKEQTQAMFPL